MSIKTIGAKVLAKKVVKSIYKWASNPEETQQKVFDKLVLEATNTSFGKAHHFDEITTYKDFAKRVPVRDYEGL